MFYVYILKNPKGEIYIGFTSDLRKRIIAHNHGSSEFTKKGRPWKIIYYEAFRSEKDARNRESTLKNYGSTLGQLKKRIADSLYNADKRIKRMNADDSNNAGGRGFVVRGRRGFRAFYPEMLLCEYKCQTILTRLKKF